MNLAWASLQGANLRVASLQGAEIKNASLQGADLTGASLLGVDLTHTSLQGADFTLASLQGAALPMSLQGANFTLASLHGAFFSTANLEGAIFDRTFTFRVYIEKSMQNTAYIRNVRTGAVKRNEYRQPTLLTATDIEVWTQSATQFVRNQKHKNAIIVRLGQLERGAVSAEIDQAAEATWKGWEEASRRLDSDGALHRKRLAGILGDLTCDANGAPYVARKFSRAMY